jgi:N-acetylmuramoyl-L-alanine amidase
MEIVPMLLDFFHLREQPFGVTPDPAYLYASRTHCEALDALTEAVLEDQGFVALIAEPGMGKTTLLYQVLEGLRESARTAYLFQTQCNSHEFLQYLLSELGIEPAGMGLVAMHSKLNELLFAEMLAGKRFVLIIDEAQNLDDEVLETIRLLSNYETSTNKLLQIVLAGQTQLGEKLQHKQQAQLLQRMSLVKHLEALSAEETAGYIKHRLRVSGRCSGELFEPEALALVAERSRGIPRIINKMCFRALLEAYGRESGSVSAEIVEKAAGRFADVACAPAASTSKPATLLLPEKAAGRLEAVVCAPATSMSKPATLLLSAVLPVGATAAMPENAAQAAIASVSPQLGYKPMEHFSLPSWSIWAGAVAAVLLSAGMAIPRHPRSQLTAKMQAPALATNSVAQRDPASEARPTPAVVQAAQRRDADETRPSEGGVPNVTSILTTSSQSDARVTVMLDQAVHYDSSRDPATDRIYFGLYKAQLSPSVTAKTVPLQNGLLRWVRAVQCPDNVVRLVLQAEGAKNFSAQVLSNPYRLVIDIHAQAPGAANAGPSAGAPLQASSSHEGHSSLTRELGLKISRIAIDPGHGGYDTGTMGPRGLLEKDLCLDVALRLGQLIEKNIPGAVVIYTRKDDRHVALEERAAIANAANADLFISIHANSSDFHEARGVETYYLSLATSPESRELATRENSVGQSSLHDLPELIKKITRNEKIAESKLLAADIQNRLSEGLQVVSGREKNRGVKQAPFVVLSAANMPAVLSEMSFVSNAKDETLLLESGQRQRVAEGLYGGIAAYLDSMHGAPVQKQKMVSEYRSAPAVGMETTAGGGGRK